VVGSYSFINNLHHTTFGSSYRRNKKQVSVFNPASTLETAFVYNICDLRISIWYSTLISLLIIGILCPDLGVVA